MPRNTYYEINLHIIWRTKNDAPVLTDHVENCCHHYLKHRALDSPDVIVHAVDGMSDPMHLAVSVPQTLLISEWIGQLKGASSHYINHEICNRSVLHWQSGYGVVSFGKKDVPWVVRYIENQKRHHASGEIHDRLERVDSPDAGTSIGKPVETG
ncbi:MAG: IS200/IS605 family transposase [Phycisphaerae bacterium]